MLFPSYCLLRLQNSHFQLFSLLPSASIPVRRHRMAHAGEYVYVFLTGRIPVRGISSPPLDHLANGALANMVISCQRRFILVA